MKFDILRFIETTNPLQFIFWGILLVSIGLNLIQNVRNAELIERLNNCPDVKIIFVPKDPEYIIPRLEQPQDLFTSTQGGVKVSIGY